MPLERLASDIPLAVSPGPTGDSPRSTFLRFLKPEAHELCVYFGRIRGGKLGGFLAGLGFMLPGFVLMFALSICLLRG